MNRLRICSSRPSHLRLVSRCAALLLATLFTALPVRPAAAAGEIWTDLRGPGEGSAQALAWDGNRDILYRAAMGRGVWRYQTGVWNDLGYAGITSFSMAYDATANILYLGAGLGEIWRCVNPDSSPTWTRIATLGTATISSLVVDEGRGIVYAGYGFSANGLLRCLNPTDTTPVWQPFAGDIAGQQVHALAFDAGRDILYVGALNGTYRALNPHGDATSWTFTGGGTSMSLAFDHTRNVLYSGTWQWGVNRLTGPDSSTSWSLAIGSGVADKGIGSLVIDESRDVLYGGTWATPDGVWRCTAPDSSPAWTAIGGPISAAIIPALAFDPTDNRLYAGINGFATGQGAWGGATPDTAPAWESLGGGLSTAGVGTMALDGSGDRLFASAGNYPWGLAAGASSSPPVWTSLGHPESTTNPAIAAIYDAARDLLYAGLSYGGVWRCSTPGGAPIWTNISGALGATVDVTALVRDAKRNILYAAIGESDHGEPRGVWRCANPQAATPTWKRLINGPTMQLAALALDGKRNLLYAAERRPDDRSASAAAPRVWRCVRPSGAFAWAQAGALPGAPTKLVVDPTRNVLYVGTHRGIKRLATASRAGAASLWKSLGGAIATQNVDALLLDTGANVLWTAGSLLPSWDPGGLFRCAKPNSVPAWQKMATPMAGEYISSLLLDTSRAQLYVGTSGLGVWRWGAP